MDMSDLLELSRFGLLRSYLRCRLESEVLDRLLVDPSLASHAFSQLAVKANINDPSDIARYCSDNLLSDTGFRYRYEYELRLRLHCDSLENCRAERRFLERKPFLDRIVYCLIRVSREALAWELYFRLSEGEASFSDLAQAYAEGPESLTLGVVGPVPLVQGHPDLVSRLSIVPEGEIQEPFFVDGWWVVIRVERRIDAVLNELTYSQMKREIFGVWLESAVEDKLRALGSCADSLSDL